MSVYLKFLLKTEKNEKTFLKKILKKNCFSQILEMDKNLKFCKICSKQTNYGPDNWNSKTLEIICKKSSGLEQKSNKKSLSYKNKKGH